MRRHKRGRLASRFSVVVVVVVPLTSALIFRHTQRRSRSISARGSARFAASAVESRRDERLLLRSLLLQVPNKRHKDERIFSATTVTEAQQRRLTQQPLANFYGQDH